MDQNNSTFSSFLTLKQVEVLKKMAHEFGLDLVRESKDLAEYVESEKGHSLLIVGRRIDVICSDGASAIAWTSAILKRINNI